MGWSLLKKSGCTVKRVSIRCRAASLLHTHTQTQTHMQTHADTHVDAVAINDRTFAKVVDFCKICKVVQIDQFSNLCKSKTTDFRQGYIPFAKAVQNDLFSPRL